MILKEGVSFFTFAGKIRLLKGLAKKQVYFQLSCGSWAKDHGDMIKTFHDARAAEEYVRRLQSGIPQGWERIAGALSIGLIVVEVLALAAVCGGHH